MGEPAVNFTLVFWNTTKNDWDASGTNRSDAEILASGDNCTYIGYTSHFTTFTIGVIVVSLNTLDPGTVRQRGRREVGHVKWTA